MANPLSSLQTVFLVAPSPEIDWLIEGLFLTATVSSLMLIANILLKLWLVATKKTRSAFGRKQHTFLLMNAAIAILAIILFIYLASPYYYLYGLPKFLK